MKNKQFGVTLIESLVTISLLTILAAIAVPSFIGAIASSQITSATNDIVAAVAKARVNAITTGSRTTICKSANGTQCTNDGDWAQGWIIFIDTTRSGNTASVAVGESLIAVSQNSAPNSISIRGDANLVQYVSFGADGTAKTMGGAPLVGKIRVCSSSTSISDTNRARDINLTFTGRTSVTKVSSDTTCASPI